MKQLKKTHFSIGRAIAFCVLVVITLVTILPLAFMFMNSLKDKVDYLQNPYGLPANPSLQNYFRMFRQYDVLQALLNSLITTSVSVLMTACVSSLASFALAKLRFPHREKMFTFLTAFMMMPIIVLLIPVYIMFSKLGLINNRWSVILFWFVGNLPYGIYMMTANMKSIPTEILESARIDGASWWQIFGRIVLPLSKPIIATMVIVYFMWTWNDLLMPMLFLQFPDKATLTVTVSTIVGKYFTNMPLLLAGLVINSIPTIFIYLFFQKYIIKGVTSGAGK